MKSKTSECPHTVKHSSPSLLLLSDDNPAVAFEEQYTEGEYLGEVSLLKHLLMSVIRVARQ